MKGRRGNTVTVTPLENRRWKKNVIDAEASILRRLGVEISTVTPFELETDCRFDADVGLA